MRRRVDNTFVVNRPPCIDEQLEGQEAKTQIGRALGELGVELILAHSPQAKGRVERFFGTAQDRLVKELRLRGISSIAQANAYLAQVYTPWWNSEHTCSPASPADAHLGAEGLDLEAIFSHQEQRHVTNDYTIQYYGQRYQIEPASQVAGLRRSAVTVQERLDGSVALWAKGQYLQAKALPPKGGAAASPAVGLRPPCGDAEPATAVVIPAPGPSGKAHTPAPNHPWRRRFLPRKAPDPRDIPTAL